MTRRFLPSSRVHICTRPAIGHQAHIYEHQLGPFRMSFISVLYPLFIFYQWRAVVEPHYFFFRNQSSSLLKTIFSCVFQPGTADIPAPMSSDFSSYSYACMGASSSIGDWGTQKEDPSIPPFFLSFPPRISHKISLSSSPTLIISSRSSSGNAG